MRKGMSALLLAVPALLFASALCPAMSQQPPGVRPSAQKERQLVIVKGAVRSSLRFELRRRVTLLEALSRAGGITKRAQGTIHIEHTVSSESDSDERVVKSVSIYRLSDLQRGERSSNPYLQAGDIVTVVLVRGSS